MEKRNGPRMMKRFNLDIKIRTLVVVAIGILCWIITHIPIGSITRPIWNVSRYTINWDLLNAQFIGLGLFIVAMLFLFGTFNYPKDDKD